MPLQSLLGFQDPALGHSTRRGGGGTTCGAAAGRVVQAVCGCGPLGAPAGPIPTVLQTPGEPLPPVPEAETSTEESSQEADTDHAEPLAAAELQAAESHAAESHAAEPQERTDEREQDTDSNEDSGPIVWEVEALTENPIHEDTQPAYEALLEQRIAAYEASPGRSSSQRPSPPELSDTPPQAEETSSASGLPVWRLPSEDSPVHSVHVGVNPAVQTPAKSPRFGTNLALGFSPAVATPSMLSVEIGGSNPSATAVDLSARGLSHEGTNSSILSVLSGPGHGAEASLASWQRSPPPAAQLSAAELVLLREQALGEVGPFWSAVPADPSPALPESRELGSIGQGCPKREATELSLLGDAGPAGNPLWTLPVPPDDPGGGEILPVHSSTLGYLHPQDTTCAPRGSMTTPPVPGDCGPSDMVPVHPSLHHGSRFEAGFPRSNGVDPDLLPHALAQAGLRAAAAVGPGAAMLGPGGLSGRSSLGSARAQLHPTGVPSVGFIGQGPFWTCGSTPHKRSRNRPRPGESQPMSATASLGKVVGGAVSSSLRAACPVGGSAEGAGAGVNSGDLAGRISNVIDSCIDILAKMVDAPTDSPPPEEELTTVVLETKEQKLHWRDFLNEAVSKCSANKLFKSYDVEASPPRYARPPFSLPPASLASSGGARSSDSPKGVFGREAGGEGSEVPFPGHVPQQLLSVQQACHIPPHIVAPRGAGWSPILCGIRRHSPVPSVASVAPMPGVATGSADKWLFRNWEGCGPKMPDGRPTCPALVSCRAAESSPGPKAPGRLELEDSPSRTTCKSTGEVRSAVDAVKGTCWHAECDEAPLAGHRPPPAG